MAAVCEMAWNQGIDLYGYDDNRFLKGAEYVAKWNLGQDVPYAPYTWRKGAPGKWSGEETFTAASPAARGDVRPIWEMIRNHYTKRRGLDAPYVTALAARVRPEGGGGDYGPNSGGFDQLGFGTLAFVRDASVVTAPAPTPGRTTGSTAHPTASPSTTTPIAGGPATSGPARTGSSQGLASTGAGEAVTYSAVGGVLAIAAGSVPALRGRRRKATRDG